MAQSEYDRQVEVMRILVESANSAQVIKIYISLFSISKNTEPAFEESTRICRGSGNVLCDCTTTYGGFKTGIKHSVWFTYLREVA